MSATDSKSSRDFSSLGKKSEFAPAGNNSATNNLSGNNITINGGGNEDQPASLANDTLGFRPYVEAVYSYLKNPKTKAPFTLSIEGDINKVL